MVLDAGGAANPDNSADSAAPETASVPTASVAAGDVLRVLPGERLPVDGVVLSGRSVADEAMLTGEAALVPKHPGDRVHKPNGGDIIGVMFWVVSKMICLAA